MIVGEVWAPEPPPRKKAVTFIEQRQKRHSSGRPDHMTCEHPATRRDVRGPVAIRLGRSDHI
jgi:hypothetical protein